MKKKDVDSKIAIENPNFNWKWKMSERTMMRITEDVLSSIQDRITKEMMRDISVYLTDDGIQVFSTLPFACRFEFKDFIEESLHLIGGSDYGLEPYYDDKEELIKMRDHLKAGVERIDQEIEKYFPSGGSDDA